MLWSSRGSAYAMKAAVLYGIEDLFSVICSKPGYIVDDQGWNWIRYTRVIRSLSLTGPPRDEASGVSASARYRETHGFATR